MLLLKSHVCARTAVHEGNLKRAAQPRSSAGPLEDSLDNMLTNATACPSLIDSGAGSAAERSVCPPGPAGVTLVSN